MEEAILKHLLDDDPCSVKGKLVTIHPGRIQSLDVINLDAMDAFQDEDPLSGIVPVDFGDVKIGLVGKVGSETVGVAPLAAVVHLGPQGIGELLGDLWQIVEPPQRGAFLDQTGQVEEDFQVYGNDILNPWALDFNYHLLATREDGTMHLGQRGRSNGFDLEGGENVLYGPAELHLNSGLDSFPGGWWYSVLKFAQLSDIGRGDEIGAGAEDLAKFDEGGPQLLDRQPRVLRQAEWGTLRLPMQQPAGKGQR